MPEKPTSLNTAPVPLKRPRQNYFEMGFKAGDRVVFHEFPAEEIVVADEHNLFWRGRKISLTKLCSTLGARKGPGLISLAGKDSYTAYDDAYGASPGSLVRNRSWTKDELILALDLYLRFHGNPPGPRSCRPSAPMAQI
jgi:hypothetical protein